MAHSCRRILVVEDDPDLRSTIVDFLVEEGIEAMSASSGADALQTLRRGPVPDVILLDLSMPGMSGPDVLRRIEAEPEWAKIPVALMSGFPRGRFAYAPPAVEYLEKPFDLDRLNDVLTKLCAKAKTGTA